MSLVQIVGANYYSVTVNVIFVLWMSDILLGRIPRLRIKHVIKYLLCGMLWGQSVTVQESGVGNTVLAFLCGNIFCWPVR